MLTLTHKKLEVYNLTKTFPKEEQYVLVTQLRRAAISVCSNIAEGSARSSKAERKRFYEIARSSVVEIDMQFEAALILKYLRENEMTDLEGYLESVFRMLSKMISNLGV